MFLYKIIEKSQIFLIALFHIGVLCSKTLDGLSRVRKYFFQNFFCFFVILLIRIMGICCGPFDFFCLGGQYYDLGHPISYGIRR